MRIAKLNRTAFTLLELIVVIVILAILAALAIPTFTRVTATSKLKSVEVTAGALIRETLALEGFTQGGITRDHVLDAVKDLGPSASAGVYAAASPTVVFGKYEFSTSPSTLSVALTQPEPSKKMGVAVWVENTGCVVGHNEGSKAVTWHYLKSEQMDQTNCNGNLELPQVVLQPSAYLITSAARIAYSLLEPR